MKSRKANFRCCPHKHCRFVWRKLRIDDEWLLIRDDFLKVFRPGAIPSHSEHLQFCTCRPASDDFDAIEHVPATVTRSLASAISVSLRERGSNILLKFLAQLLDLNLYLAYRTCWLSHYLRWNDDNAFERVLSPFHCIDARHRTSCFFRDRANDEFIIDITNLLSVESFSIAMPLIPFVIARSALPEPLT